MWMTSCIGNARRGLWGFFKKSGSWVLRSEEKGWISLARGGLATGAHVLGWGRWKNQNRKNVYLSPYAEEPLNSKVIKSFAPELGSRVFRVSGFLCSMYMLYIGTLWTSYVPVWICPFHVFISSYVTIRQLHFCRWVRPRSNNTCLGAFENLQLQNHHCLIILTPSGSISLGTVYRLNINV